MKIYLESLGCARNRVDSEEMLGRIVKEGHTIAHLPDDADSIIVNTCGFIESAAEESVDAILSLARHKEENVCRRLIVTGCLPQRYGKAITDTLPEVDAFVGTGAFDRITAYLEDKPETDNNRICLLPTPENHGIHAPKPRYQTGQKHSAYLKIIEGCDRSCTYCVIPKLRGRQRSRPIKTLVAEAETLIRQGAREITLVAQESTRYGKDLKNGINLSALLTELSALDNHIRIRVLYGHPESLSDEIIRTMGKLPNICPYFDVPFQHAADSVLKRMGRRYRQPDLFALINKIRARISEAAVRTTMMVGFPGETDDDFNELLSFVETVRFDHLGAFIYSDADDLASFNLPGKVSPGIAENRYDRLLRRQRTISAEINRKYLNQTLRVLVEENPEPGVYTGRTLFQAPEVDGIVFMDVHKPRALKIGEFSPVRITDTMAYDLIGEPL